MALNGYFENKFQTGYSLRVEWEVNSQSIADNTSSLTVTAFLVSLGGSYTIESDYPKDMTMTIDGTVYSGQIPNATLSGNQKRQIMTQTVTVRHNTDGTRSVSMSFGLYLYATLSGTKFRWIYAPASGSVSATLDTIPRASKPTLSASTIELGKTLTIYTNRASSAFTHKLLYGWYGTEYVQIAANVGASHTWTVPLTFANNIPDATKGWGTIRCETYSGSTKLGTAEVTFTATVPASMKPTCSLQVLDATDTKDTYGSLVKTLSKLYVKTTATPSYNSPITAYRVTANGQQYTAAEITTGVLTAAGTTTVSAYVTDKRGRVSTTASASFPVLDYIEPKVTALSVHRCNEDGTEDENGEYIKATFSAAVTALNNKNTATYTLQYKKSTAGEYTTVNLSALANKYTVTNHNYIFAADSDASYNIVVTVADNHGSGSRETSASTAFTLMNWSADGTGMGVGKVSEESNTLEVALNNHFYGHTRQEGNRYAFSSPGVAGSGGFVKMAQVQITAANADTPITFVFSRRQAVAPMTVHLRLSNSTATSSSLASIRYEGANYDVYAHAPDALTWDIYVLKGSNYDTITLQDWYTSASMQSRVRVSFPGELVDQVPTPYHKATPVILDSILDAFMPVGYVLILYSHADPNTMYPGSTWARIENAFLWATTSGGTIGQTGGEAEHVLTVAEMPSHSHGNVYSANARGDKTLGWFTTAGDKLAYGTVLNGAGEAHNNMPPYIQVSVWRRTA